jgi:hypothetical protein
MAAIPIDDDAVAIGRDHSGRSRRFSMRGMWPKSGVALAPAGGHVV